MTRDIKYKWGIFILSILLLLAGYFNEARFESRKDPYNSFYTTIQNKLNEKQIQSNQLLEDEDLIEKIHASNFAPELINRIKSEGLDIMVYEDDSLQYWTDKSVHIDTAVSKIPDGVHVYLSDNGWYQIVKKSIYKYDVLSFYLIKTEYSYQNQYLTNQLNPDFGIKIEGSIIDQPREGYTDIHDTEGGFLFGFKVTESEELPTTAYLLYLLGFVMFIFSIETLLNKYIKLREPVKALAAYLISITVFWWLTYNQYLFTTIFSHEVFKPDIYASSFLLSSLGDLAIHALYMFVVAFAVYRVTIHNHLLKPKVWGSNLLKYTSVIALYLSLLFTGDLILNLIRSLVRDSNISFNVNQLSSLTQYTLISIILIGLMLLSFVFIQRILTKYLQNKIGIWAHIALFVLCSAAFLQFQIIDGRQQYSNLIISVIFVALMLAVSVVFSRINMLQKGLMHVIIFAAFSAFIINLNTERKERQYREFYAGRVLTQNDIDAEYLFFDIEKKLETDPRIAAYFIDGSIEKQELQEKIRQLYFTGYLNKYEVEVLDYDSIGNGLAQQNPMTFDELNHLYNKHTTRTISDHFLYLSNPAPISGYIAKFEVCTDVNKYGNLFILLKPKFLQGDYIYPELLEVNNNDAGKPSYEYSYAIYKYNMLSNQSGKFAYPLNNRFMPLDSSGFFNYKGYSHYLYSTNDIKVLVSKKQKSFFESLATYSFMIIFIGVFLFTLLVFNLLPAIIGLGIASLRKNKRALLKHLYKLSELIPFFRARGLFLSTRIQLSMIVVVFVGLLTTIYFTITYINYQYNERQNEKLLTKVRAVVNEIESDNNFREKLKYPAERTAFINRISDFYETDINLYSPDGQLLASTKQKIFDAGISAMHIDPLAYFEMHTLLNTQYVHNEKVGSLDYLSAYMPLLDVNQRVIAYLNLPYFTKRSELNAEISSFVVSFINIYALFFLIAGWLAYVISKRVSFPLTLIREKLSTTQLGIGNEQIEWRRKDEIGQLVLQYNKMIKQLAKSADMLAKSEREGAWKEMAKQVAHEIKNPLTPMKLSVQHLQRAWKADATNKEEMFDRVTNLLIQQIDSLSNLAGEFSSFAKMPTSTFEEINIVKVVKANTDLYHGTEGVQLSFTSSEEEAIVYGDYDQLSRVFGNLIKNAIQAIPEDTEGQIDVVINKIDNNSVTINIIDNGTGIEAEEADKIFSPNFSTKTSGMGLGLAITKKIVEAHLGEIKFSTEVNKGTTFYVILPLHQG